MIPAGSLNRTITLQRLSQSVDGYGQQVTAWTDLDTVRASLRQRTTREFVRDFGEDDTAVTVFTIRYFDDLTTADRVLFDGEAYNIREIAEIGRRVGLELRCEATQ